MNRHERRRSAATGQPSPEELKALLDGCRWERKVDPNDKRFFTITIRLPESDPDRPDEAVSGGEVQDRLQRFCVGFMGGYTGPAMASKSS